MSDATDNESDNDNEDTSILQSEMSIGDDNLTFHSDISFAEPVSEMSIDERSVENIPENNQIPEIPEQTEDSINEIIEPKIPQELPTHILPSNEDIILSYKLKRQSFPREKIETLAGEIAEELISIWKSARIPTLATSRVKIDITNIIKRDTGNKLSKKAMKKSSIQGFHKDPNDCCIISSCRHFIKAKEKTDINLDFCDCKEENKIPPSRLSFFQSNMFDR